MLSTNYGLTPPDSFRQSCSPVFSNIDGTSGCSPSSLSSSPPSSQSPVPAVPTTDNASPRALPLPPASRYRCELCPEAFSFPMRLKYVSTQCKTYTGASLTGYRQHISTIHLADGVCSYSGCTMRFLRRGDLDRHVKETHLKNTSEEYRCKCSYVSQRRANYIRHLKKCSNDSFRSVYHCPCGHDDKLKGDHETHLATRCGAVRTRGRKRKTMVS